MPQSARMYKMMMVLITAVSRLVVVVTTADAQEVPQDATTLQIEATDPQVVNESFPFTVVLYAPPLSKNKVIGKPIVSCGQQVECNIGKTKSEPGQIVTECTATLRNGLTNAVEITASQEMIDSKGKRFVKANSLVVPIGIQKYSLEAVFDHRDPISGGSIEGAYFRFKNGDTIATPSLPVTLTMDSKCSYLRPDGGTSRDFGRTAKVTFGHEGRPANFSNRVDVEPTFWAVDTCTITGDGYLVGQHSSVELPPIPATFLVNRLICQRSSWRCWDRYRNI